MEDEPRLLGGEEDEVAPASDLGYWTYHLWLDGICITIDDCPECLRRVDFDCQFCEFFCPDRCRLLNEPFLLRETRALFSIYREQRAAYAERHRKVMRTIYTELAAHGRPLHCTVLAHIIADRHPHLDITERGIAAIMSAHPDRFERLRPGVYRCRRRRR